MEDAANLVNYSLLTITAHQKLIEYGVISSECGVELYPHCRVLIGGKRYFYFLIMSTNSPRKFFLKVVKNNDGALLCNDFLKRIRDENGYCPYPIIVVPELEVQGTRYYITNFLEGQPLSVHSDILTKKAWDDIADKLQGRLDELSAIQTAQYSEHNEFVPDSFAVIQKRKFEARLRHPLISDLPRKKLERALEQCYEILDKCQFSKPTLLHMDIKPANIIYDPQTGSVSLIDFEFSRFGDIDYGWAQILLSGYNRFGRDYKEQLIPRLTRGRLTMENALDIPKFQTYLFYQTMCNLIYYYDRNIKCPEDMQTLFAKIINIW